MGFEVGERTLNHLFSGNSYIFKIPRYQRNYVWSHQKWKQLIDDIDSVIDYEDRWNHFLGSVVFEKTSNKTNRTINDLIIIDGQQRLTTLQIIIFSLIYYYKKRVENKTLFTSDDELSKIKSYLDVLKDLIMTKIPGETTSGKLLFDMDNNFVTFNSYSIGDSKTEQYDKIIEKNKSSNIVKAFKFIKEYFEKKDLSYVMKFQNAMINIRFVMITSEQEEEAYSIFEVLNARGTQLKQFELMKNYIFRYIQPKEILDEAKNDWISMEENLSGIDTDDFLLHFIRMKYYKSNLKKEEVYEFIKSIHLESNLGVVREVEMLFDELKEASIEYRDIVNCQNKENNYLNIINYFIIKQNKQVRSILLALGLKLKNEIITDSEYFLAIEYIRNYFVFFNIRSNTSNKIDSMIHKLANSIYLCENALEIELNIRKFIYENRVIFDHNDNVRKFKELQYSNKSKIITSTSKFFAYLFENTFSCTKQEIKLDFKNITIEHILNDSSNDSQYWQIGNLIPLEKQINEGCNTKNYENKRLDYSKSSLYYTRNFAENNLDFNEEKMKSRTDYLAEKFAKKFEIDIEENKIAISELTARINFYNFIVVDNNLSNYSDVCKNKNRSAMLKYISNSNMPENIRTIFDKGFSLFYK